MPAKIGTPLLSFCLSAALISPVRADESAASGTQPRLEHLLEVAARNTKKHFIVAGVVPDVSWVGVDENAVSYPLLLTILADNNLTAIEDSGVVNIVPLPNVRSYPTLTLTAQDLDKTRVPDDQVITALVHIEHIDGEKLLPILRPLMPQWGQLSAATETNTLIMTDRYANARRIADIVHRLDQLAQSK